MTLCEFTAIGTTDTGRTLCRCQKCGKERSTALSPALIRMTCNGSRGLVGSEFKAAIKLLGYTKGKKCDCAAIEAKMNQLGPDGCRKEIESLAAAVVKSARKQKVTITIEMARWAIDEAIRRAKATAQQSPAQPSLPESVASTVVKIAS